MTVETAAAEPLAVTVTVEAPEEPKLEAVTVTVEAAAAEPLAETVTVEAAAAEALAVTVTVPELADCVTVCVIVEALAVIVEGAAVMSFVTC